MPVKFFVSKDARGQERAPDYSHETRAVIDIIRQVYAAFNHHPRLCALVANLTKQAAHADLVILTERGIGILELKHYPGRIFQQGHSWHVQQASHRQSLINGGNNNRYGNPHRQVQAYGGEILTKLIKNPHRPPWLPGRHRDWENLKFHTAVCFTNPAADIVEFRRTYIAHREKWEGDFCILHPAEIPEWVASLRFDAQIELIRDHRREFWPFELLPSHILQIVTDLFSATEWTEIQRLMPSGEPYGYLLLKVDDTVITHYSLRNDRVLIGRGAGPCDIHLPETYSKVSGQHGQISRTIDKVFFEDLRSTNGTFINHRRITREQLKEGMQLCLGSQSPAGGACLLEYTLVPPEHTPTKIDSF